MISIKAAVSTLERSELLRSRSAEAHRAALVAIRRYAIEVDPKLLERHERNLAAMEIRLGESLDPEAVQEVSSALRSELRSYRDGCTAWLQRLRTDLDNNSRLLDGIAAAMTETEAEDGEKFEEELTRLRRLASGIAQPEISSAVRGAAESLERCIETIRQQHQQQLAQLSGEIQVLHRRVEQLELGPSLGARVLSRAQTENKLEACVTEATGFCVLLFRLRNLRTLTAEFGPEPGDVLFDAFCRRLRAKLGEDAPMGRWSDYQVLGIVASSKADTISRSRDLLSAVSGIYSFPDGGSARRVPLQVECGVAEFNPGDGIRKVLSTLERLSQPVG
jgi:GGDEF domain-containing protein